MKRIASLTLALVMLTGGYALANEGTEEFAKRLAVTTHYNCPAPIESIPSTYPLDGN